jgi:branched-chain amino acid transport system ATP-binding protein
MGLAPLIVEQLYERVAELARGGLSILIVEQFVQTVLGVCDVAAVMLHGRVALTGNPHDVARDATAAYLGTTA